MNPLSIIFFFSFLLTMNTWLKACDEFSLATSGGSPIKNSLYNLTISKTPCERETKIHKDMLRLKSELEKGNVKALQYIPNLLNAYGEVLFERESLSEEDMIKGIKCFRKAHKSGHEKATENLVWALQKRGRIIFAKENNTKETLLEGAMALHEASQLESIFTMKKNIGYASRRLERIRSFADDSDQLAQLLRKAASLVEDKAEELADNDSLNLKNESTFKKLTLALVNGLIKVSDFKYSENKYCPEIIKHLKELSVFDCMPHKKEDQVTGLVFSWTK